jgi:hypothetical protein
MKLSLEKAILRVSATNAIIQNSPSRVSSKTKINKILTNSEKSVIKQRLT